MVIYSEFDNMQLELRREHPDIEEDFPLMPSKTWWFPPGDDSFLESRSDELSKFIEDLLTVFSNKRVLQAEAQTLYEFLKMKNHSGEGVPSKTS